MHRLQITLPEWQHQFLYERAQDEGVSMAEIVRRLVEKAAEQAQRTQVDSIWDIVGLAEDRGPLLGGIPVSSAPDLYLTEAEIASWNKD